MIKYKVVAIVVKLVPSSFTNVMTECNKPNLSNKDWSCVTMDYLVVLFISNNPIVICMGAHVSFKKLITITKVFTSPQDI
jgi:hypothetical protein